MNALDIIVLTFIGLLVFNGIRKGFIISFASLVGLVLGIYAAVHFSNYIGKILQDNLQTSASWLPVLSFSLTFLAVIIVVMLIAQQKTQFIRQFSDQRRSLFIIGDICRCQIGS